MQNSFHVDVPSGSHDSLPSVFRYPLPPQKSEDCREYSFVVSGSELAPDLNIQAFMMMQLPAPFGA